MGKKTPVLSATLDSEVEEGLTVRDVMVMAAEEVLIKNGTIKGASFDEVFGDLEE